MVIGIIAGDTCCFPFSMGHVKNFIEEKHNGTYVYSVMIGNNIIAVSSTEYMTYLIL